LIQTINGSLKEEVMFDVGSEVRMNGAAGVLRRALRWALMMCLLTIAFHGSAIAQSQRPLKTLTVLGFEGAFNLPVWIAQQNGYFERQGLIVKLEYPKGSVEVVERLQANTGQLALTSVDNVIAYANGQGETTPGLAADLVAVMGGDHGMLSLVARSDVRTVVGLEGRSVAVDAMTTGFAFVAQDLLASEGLQTRSVEWVTAGGTGSRYRALVAGKFDATLLRPPYEYLAEQKGFRVLMRAQSVLPKYLGTVGAVRSQWAKEHSAELEGFLTAYRQALNWFARADNRDAVLALLVANFPELRAEDARKVYEDLRNPAYGLIPTLEIDEEEFATVERLRAKRTSVQMHIGAEPPIDLSYLRRAQARTDWQAF
jgi:ABC-type nitrate/sulfonate/bicarbonate transport system substrate-binding protein